MRASTRSKLPRQRRLEQPETPAPGAVLGALCVNTRLHSKKVFFFTGRFKVLCSV